MKINKLALIMTVILLIQSVFIVNGATDSSILSEPVSNTYDSRAIGKALINNISFTDMISHWAQEPVSRLGALEIVKGVSDGAYRPNGTVTKEEALTLLVRVLGMEQAAIQAAQTIAQQNPSNDSLATIWSKGYLQIAANIGLITNANLTDALVSDQTTLDPTINFIRTDAVTREQIAKWIVDAINVINPGQISPVYTQQQIFNYSDWQNMGVDYTPYIETVTRAQIMVGSGGAFNPKGSVTRAEMAQIIENIDNVLYSTMKLQRKGGTVGAVYDYGVVNTLTGMTTRAYLIRNENGTVDRFNYEYDKNALDQISTKDTPVYKGGTVQGMSSLEEGDSIEYIVNPSTNELLYINDKGSSGKNNITGALQPLTNISQGEITIKTESGNLYTYKLRSALYDAINQTIQIGDKTYTVSGAPIGHLVTLTVQNAIVTDIAYKGDQVICEEIGGIVKAINPSFSYITITDWNGKEVTKNYNKNEVKVEKQNYYDTSDDIGYIDEMFPDYRFDPRDSSVDMIEPGDVVYLKIDPTDSNYVTMISAKTNYVAKYGTIKSLSSKGSDGLSVVITFDDGSLGTYDISSDIPVLKSSANVGTGELAAGQVVRMLVNQAVIQPGTIKEAIKEIVIDEYGNKIANIYKGQLGKVDPVQRKLSILNTYQLTNLGWKDYVAAKSFDISTQSIRYYKDGKQVSQDYAQKYLISSDIDAYVVTSDYYGLEKVEKVAFRSGRDSVLDFTNVTYSNGMDKINLLSQSDGISLDDGTIVIKNGKLVEVGNVISPDYAQVVLNGNNKAAVVNIQTEPNNDAITVMRGRIESIEDSESFTVQSNALLMDMTWVYSPVSREYNLTKDTMIYDDQGAKISFGEFIDYSDISKVDEVYTIIAEGTDAKYVVQNPYAKEGVKGQIYEVDSDKLMIKDVLVYSSGNSNWSELSLTNSYGQINLLDNSVIIKNNKVVSASNLTVGDKIRVMTTENLSYKLANQSARDVDGYIIFVEK